MHALSLSLAVFVFVVVVACALSLSTSELAIICMRSLSSSSSRCEHALFVLVLQLPRHLLLSQTLVVLDDPLTRCIEVQCNLAYRAPLRLELGLYELASKVSCRVERTNTLGRVAVVLGRLESTEREDIALTACLQLALDIASPSSAFTTTQLAHTSQQAHKIERAGLDLLLARTSLRVRTLLNDVNNVCSTKRKCCAR